MHEIINNVKKRRGKVGGDRFVDRLAIFGRFHPGSLCMYLSVCARLRALCMHESDSDATDHVVCLKFSIM